MTVPAPTTAPAPPAASRQAGLRRVVLALVVLLAGSVLLVLTGQISVARVTTASMAPAVPVGTLVIGLPVRPEHLRRGDVLTAHVPALGATVTHRVVGLLQEGDRTLVRTRGDANTTDDPWTTVLPDRRASRVVGAVPHLGTVLGRGPGGVPLLTVPLLVLVATWAGCRRLLSLLGEAR